MNRKIIKYITITYFISWISWGLRAYLTQIGVCDAFDTIGTVLFIIVLQFS